MIVEAETTYSNAAQTTGTLDATNYVTINGVDIQGVTLSSTSDTALAEYITSHVDGVTATVDSSDKLVLTAEDGRNITVAAAGTGATITGLAAGTHHGELTITGGSSFTVTQNTTDFLGLGATTVSSSLDSTANVSQLDVTTKDNANKAIMIVDFAIDSLNAQRSTIGGPDQPSELGRQHAERRGRERHLGQFAHRRCGLRHRDGRTEPHPDPAAGRRVGPVPGQLEPAIGAETVVLTTNPEARGLPIGPAQTSRLEEHMKEI